MHERETVSRMKYKTKEQIIKNIYQIKWSQEVAKRMSEVWRRSGQPVNSTG